MKHILTIALLVCAFAMPERVNAERFNTLSIGQLYDDCRKKDGPRYLRCLSFMHGLASQRVANCLILQGWQNFTDSQQTKETLKRIAQISANEFGKSRSDAWAQSFVNWAEDHPEEWSSDALFLGMNARSGSHFLDAWPCELDKD